MTFRRSAASLLVVLALTPRPASADVSDVDRATARALTLEGYEALDRKDYAIAADRFSRADALYHVPTVTLGLAHAEVGLGKLVSALAIYSRIMREGVPPSAPPAFVKAVEDARREIEPLTQRIPNVIVTVRGASDAVVTIDGVEVPVAALGVKRPVDPGSHVVRATAKGFVASEVKITVLEGKVEPVTFELERETPAPVVSAPPPVLPVPAPSVTPRPAPTSPPPPPAPEQSSPQRLLGFVALGVGGGGVALGAITGGLAVAKHGSLLDACPGGHCTPAQQAALQPDVDSYKTLGTVATAAFLVGGVGIGAGAILLLTAPRPRSAPSARLIPVIAPGYAGLKGSF